MVLSFSYKKEKLPNGIEVFRPTIPIEIGYNGASMKFVAIVDSGSDESYIPKSIAEILGIETKGRQTTVSTINGTVKVITTLIKITIRHKSETERFTVPVDVPVEEDGTNEIILGRRGFFDRFDITFKENSKRIILTRSRRE